METKYYIYHIPTFLWKDGSIGKIGVSVNPKTRTISQKHRNYEILETHTDIMKVSEREIELQKQYGYKVDTIPYYKTYELAITGKGGKAANGKGGKNNSIENKIKAGKHKRIISYNQAQWIRLQYQRKFDIFNKKITYQRLGNVFGVKRQAIYFIVKNITITEDI